MVVVYVVSFDVGAVGKGVYVWHFLGARGLVEGRVKSGITMGQGEKGGLFWETKDNRVRKLCLISL